MEVLLDRFKRFYGEGTKQIGRYFCIPASLCNAVRFCGVSGCTQEEIRDAWYAEQGKSIEPSLDDQMDGVGIGLFETMERRIDGIGVVGNSFFDLPGDSDPIDLRKAELALSFIEKHIDAEHPVIVSTWNRILKGDIIEIHGFHMWLILGFDRTTNLATYHDSGPDEIRQTPITKLHPITLNGKEIEFDLGLRLHNPL